MFKSQPSESIKIENTLNKYMFGFRCKTESAMIQLHAKIMLLGDQPPLEF